MKKQKLIFLFAGLYLLSAFAFIFQIFITPSSVSAQASNICNPDTIGVLAGEGANEAEVAACKAGNRGALDGKTMEETCRSYRNANGNNEKKFCELGYRLGGEQDNQTDNVCARSVVEASAGRSATDRDIAACKVGYKGALDGKIKRDVCDTYRNGNGNNEKLFCEVGYGLFYGAIQGVAENCKDSTLSEQINRTPTQSDIEACQYGYVASLNGKDKADACKNFGASGTNQRQSCEAGFDLRVAQLAGGGTSSDEDGDCDAGSGGPLSWILCPLIDGGADLTDAVYAHFMKPLLENVPIGSSPKDPGYVAWRSFRTLGNILLAGCLMILVYAQARGEK